jgi:predicted HTH transcriptional regulator
MIHLVAMTLRELEQLVALGEGISLEFKRRVPRPERIAKEIVALANTKGGRIVLGVSDNGRIEGFENVSEQQFLLRQATEAHCDPPVEYDTERVVVADRRDVIVVSVPESSRKPHLLVVDGEGEAPVYVRVEDRSVEASAETTERLRHQESGEGVTFEFGETESLLMRYLDDYGRITVPQLAQLADISPERASQTLLRLVRADLLHLHSSDDGDYFTLNY